MRIAGTCEHLYMSLLIDNCRSATRLFTLISVLTLIIFHLLAGFSTVASDEGVETKKDQITEIESNLLTEKEKLDAFDDQEKGLLSRLADFEQDVADQRCTVKEIERKIGLSNIAIKNSTARLVDLKKSKRDAEARLAERLVTVYKYGRKGHIKVLLHAADLEEFWHRLKYLKVIMAEDQKTLFRLSNEEIWYREEISRVEGQVAEDQASMNEAGMRLISLRSELEKKVICLMKIHKEKEFYETAVKELGLASQNLKQTLAKIEKKDDYKGIRSSRFVDARGRLPFPVNGRAIRPDELSAFARLGLHKGVFIDGTSDVGVKAIFPGRVDFSGHLKGYGQIIIINHGSRFFTISALLSERQKKTGDMVEAGTVIGLAGENRPAKRQMLYFEIRRGGENLDPLEWIVVHRPPGKGSS